MNWVTSPNAHVCSDEILKIIAHTQTVYVPVQDFGGTLRQNKNAYIQMLHKQENQGDSKTLHSLLRHWSVIHGITYFYYNIYPTKWLSILTFKTAWQTLIDHSSWMHELCYTMYVMYEQNVWAFAVPVQFSHVYKKMIQGESSTSEQNPWNKMNTSAWNLDLVKMCYLLEVVLLHLTI